MKKQKEIKLIKNVSLITIILFLLGFLFLKQLQTGLVWVVTLYGPIALIIITFLVESIPQPIGPEISLFAGTAIGMNAVVVIVITALTSMVASLFNFKIGKTFYPKVCVDKTCEKYTKNYRKYGKILLFFAAIGPIPYVPFCWISGAFGLKLKKFIYIGIIPRTIRIIIVGVFFSNLLPVIF